MSLRLPLKNDTKKVNNGIKAKNKTPVDDWIIG